MNRTDSAGESDQEWLLGAVEAVLMVVAEPVPPAALATAVGRPQTEVETALRQLQQEYQDAPRRHGMELREVAGGWRFYSAAEFGDVVETFVRDGQTARLTQAGLETLAVIAYRQPVSRGRISAIRGVNVDSVVRTLLTHGLVEESGRDEEGGATLYRTTTYFLERVGLGSLDELPPLAPYLPEMDALDDLDGELS